jgi:hypothetical protein
MNFHKFHVSLTLEGEYFFNNEGFGRRYSNGLPTRLLKELKERPEDDPLFVALGIDNTFVLVGKKGDVFWDLKGHYGRLDQKLKELDCGVKV